jgi:hypothetical protein
MIDTAPISREEARALRLEQQTRQAELIGWARPDEPEAAALLCALGSALGQAAYWRHRADVLEWELHGWKQMQEVAA